jgi:methyl-accepting chemotaxis protein
MTNKLKSATSNVWVIAMALGILGCLGGVAYTFTMVQQESGQEGEYRLASDKLRILSQQVTANARESVLGDEATFRDLKENLESFSVELDQLQVGALADEALRIKERWTPVHEASQMLLEAGPSVVYLETVSSQLEQNVRPIQDQFEIVVDVLENQPVSSGTLIAAQKAPWLAERIARNLAKIQLGGADSLVYAKEFRTDTGSYAAVVNALSNGSSKMGVDRVNTPRSVRALDNASARFAIVSNSVDKIAGAAAQMREAATARDAIARDENGLSDAIAALVPAIEKLTVARLYDRSTLLALFAAPGILAIGLLVVLYRNQRRRVLYTEQGVAAINGALVRIAEGDLTVQVSEDNSVTRDIAREINASTERQRELIRNIKTPFKISADGITKIGMTAEGQVDKGRELTRSVEESNTATTEMVRTAEEIKTSTAEAARTSERNRQRVTQGYELTKDMSKASANVRESVQETSKSAKRQGELIQSVTAAAEYIQSLNTKISVVAINTRIEAEKAGEHGRPFLGIAEAIGDLLREAEDEGRKIISEVRMLQNLSADNLSSMENTVGTVVTILEYIDRLDSSLEEINAGSSAITSIITSVDDAAGQSATTARHINSSMDEIRERNLDICEYSESTQVGVSSLKASMRDVADSLRQFKIESEGAADLSVSAVDDLKHIQNAKKIYREEEMKAFESTKEARALV